MLCVSDDDVLVLQRGNIAEALLKEGFARCVDWSMASMKSGSVTLRKAEKAAKEARIRIWKDYQATGPQVGYFDTVFVMLTIYLRFVERLITCAILFLFCLCVQYWKTFMCIVTLMSKINVVTKYLFCARSWVRRKNMQLQLWKLSMEMH
jgi:hypothetical protein